jgi:transposase
MMDINKILKIRQFKAIEIEERNGEILIFGELKHTEKHCPKCNTLAIKPNQYYKKKLRSVPFNGMPTFLVFTHKSYLCNICGRRFLEGIDFAEKQRIYTIAYEEHIYETVRGRDIQRAADQEKLNWHTINDIFLKGREKKEGGIKERTKNSRNTLHG